MFGSARLFMAVDHHGSGRELLRIRSWSRPSLAGLSLMLFFSGLSFAAGLDKAWPVSMVLSATALLLAVRTVQECAATTAAFLTVVRDIERVEEKRDRETS